MMAAERKPTTGGLNSSPRSGKLDRKRVSRVSMGSSKMMDEVGVICFRSFFRDAGTRTVKTVRQNYTSCQQQTRGPDNISARRILCFTKLTKALDICQKILK